MEEITNERDYDTYELPQWFVYVRNTLIKERTAR